MGREIGFFLGAGAEADLNIPTGTNFLSDIFLTYPKDYLDNKPDDFEYSQESLRLLSKGSYDSYNGKYIVKWINRYFVDEPNVYYHIKNSSYSELILFLKNIHKKHKEYLFKKSSRMNDLVYLPFFITAQYFAIENNKDISEFFKIFIDIPKNVYVNSLLDDNNNYVINDQEYNKPLFVQLLKNTTFRKFELDKSLDEDRRFCVMLREYFARTTQFGGFLSLLYTENVEMKYNRNLPLIGNIIRMKFEDDTKSNREDFKKSVYEYISKFKGYGWSLITTNYTSYLSVIAKPQPEDLIALHGNFEFLYNRDTMSFEKLNSHNDCYSDTVFPFLILQSRAKTLDEVFFMRKFIDFFDRFNDTRFIVILGYSFSKDDNHINKIFKTLCKSSKVENIFYLNYNGEADIPEYLKNEKKFKDVFYSKDLLKKNNGFMKFLKPYGFEPIFNNDL